MLSGIVVVALTVSMLGYLTRLVERKESYQKYDSFFQQEEDFDVLFMGTSHVVNGIFPMELWEDQGMISYNMAGHMNRIPVTYWALKSALDETTPSLVVIDCFWLGLDEKNAAIRPQRAHATLDVLPFSVKKAQMILDLFEDPDVRMSYLWDFSIYHDRWNELGKEDFSPKVSLEKGAESRIGVVAERAIPLIDKTQVFDGYSVGIEYLEKAIEMCQERDIDVLLVYLPFMSTETDQMEANRVPDIAERYGIGYIDFLDLNVVDYGTDFYDVEHLNPSGARKVTSFLGQYIKEHYHIPDRRGDPDYTDWYTSYEAYTRFKLDNLAAQTSITNYLMLMQDKHLSSCVYLTENSLWHEDSIYDKLLENMGIDSDQLLTGGPTLAVVDNRSGKQIYLAPGDSQQTSFGTVSFELTDEAPKVLVNGAAGLEPVGNAAIAAMVIDDASGRIATTSQFAVSGMATSITKIS